MLTQSYVSFRFLLKCVHFKRNDSVQVVSDFLKIKFSNENERFADAITSVMSPGGLII